MKSHIALSRQLLEIILLVGPVHENQKAYYKNTLIKEGESWRPSPFRGGVDWDGMEKEEGDENEFGV